MASAKTLVIALAVLCILQCVLVMPYAAAEGDASSDAGSIARDEAASFDGLSPSERKLVEQSGEKFEFQAEVSRLMDIIINSLYSKKEIFLRELISNASDACDKIRFLALSDPKLTEDKPDYEIRIEANKEANTLSITDSGIGMSKKDLINNLGTIAKSGTSQFLEQAAKGDNLHLIGQFGVGFYSVYLVADKVTVTSKSPSEPQYIWESAADAAYTIAEDPRGATLGRGTRVTLHLKKDAAEYLEESTLRNLIKRYSEFINFPIFLHTTKEVDKEVAVEEEPKPKDETTEQQKKDDDDETQPEVKEVEDEEAKKPKTKTVKEKVSEWERVNKNKAIWLRDPKDITKDEYNAFYQSLSKDSSDAASHIHFSAEGQIDFKAILFIPKTAPKEMFDKMNSKLENIKLYVRRVFISDSFDDLVPRYLNFIVGVVDSEDLPLNVSREMLQQSRVLKVIKKKLISKALDMIKKMSDKEDKAVDKLEEEAGGEKKDKKKKEDDEKQVEDEDEAEEEEEDESEGAVKEEPKDTVKNYNAFLEQYSKSIKLGIVEDAKNRKKLAKFVRFRSTKTKDGESVSLQRYIDRLAVGQKHIYYITGDDHKELLKSPYLEKLLKRGYEVLVMTDPMDEYMMQHLDEFEDHTFVNVAKEDIKFGDKQEKAEKKRVEKKKEDLKSFIDWYKELLKDSVEKVVISNRLTDTPLAVVSGQYGYTAHMERLMKAQALADPSRYQFMSSKKTVEINPFHPLIADLASRVEKDKDDESLKVVAQTLFDAALVQGDFELVDKTRFTQSVVSLLNDKMGLDATAKAEVPELSEEDEEDKKDEEKEGEDKSSEDAASESSERKDEL